MELIPVEHQTSRVLVLNPKEAKMSLTCARQRSAGQRANTARCEGEGSAGHHGSNAAGYGDDLLADIGLLYKVALGRNVFLVNSYERIALAFALFILAI